ncbi:MAG: presqualene diphosphate synthase HpnD [Acidiferrobacterales bacterium]
MTPAEYCQQKVGAPGSSFYYSVLYLPVDKREALTAIYAYCCEIEEILDKCQEPDVARAKLAWWRQETQNILSHKPNHPIGRALQTVIAAHRLPEGRFAALIDGVEMSLSEGRFDTFEALRSHCERVGATASVLAAHVLGYGDPVTLDSARELGVALTLTKVIRDLRAHASRNRIYIPLEDLRRYDVPIAHILNGTETSELRALVEFECGRAEQCYDRALALIPEKDRWSQLSGLIMAAIYRRTLDEIRRDGYHVMRHRTHLPPLRKLWIAWTTRRKERRRSRRRIRF